MIKYEVRVNLGSLGKRLEEGARLAEGRLCSEVLSSCGRFVPYRTGELYSSGSVIPGGVKWSAPHAAECYYAVREFSKKRHPQACARWFEAAKSADLALWLGGVRII